MLKTFKINKMSRDKDPFNMQQDQINVHVKANVSPEQLRQYYKAKLVEESLEVQAADSKQELVEELADCLEVIQGMASAFAISMDNILQMKHSKRKKRGGFESGTIIDTVDMSSDHYQAKIFSQQPEKYPEVD